MVVFVFSTVSITTVDYANAVPMDKVTICHYPPGNHDNPRTIEVNGNSLLPAHLEHGDTIGPCESDNEARPLNQKARPLNQKARPLNQKARPLNQKARPLNQKARPLNSSHSKIKTTEE